MASLCKEFCFDTYDAIGFDLDGTLLRYNLNEMIPLEHKLLCQFLVDQRGYPSELLEKKLDLNFVQKGLVLDAEKGNILKLNNKARIIRATHGTIPLTTEQIEDIYGIHREWDISTQFFKNPLSTWNGPSSMKLRTLLDYFDLGVSMVFAQAVDITDAVASKREEVDHLRPYKIWPDILDGLVQMYSRENFSNGRSAYFTALKNNPERYLLRVPPRVLQWMKDLRASGKALFMLTGSNIDFADFTASYSIGADWQNYFDCVVCFAKKPGFFTQRKPFLQVEGKSEIKDREISLTTELPLNAIYSQGNWHQLQMALAEKIGKSANEARYLYLGDNLIQDVYTPVKHHDFDSVAICEELLAEKDLSTETSYEFQQVVGSTLWGSYFYVDDQPTLWSDIIAQYSQLCIPSIETVVETPIAFRYCENSQKRFPNVPLSTLQYKNTNI